MKDIMSPVMSDLMQAVFGDVVVPPAVTAYWTEVASLISTYGGDAWPMADNGNGDDILSLGSVNLSKNGTNTPTYLETFTAYPALRGIETPGSIEYNDDSGIGADIATTGDETVCFVIKTPVSLTADAAVWSVDDSGSGNIWSRYWLDNTNKIRYSWEYGAGTNVVGTVGTGTFSTSTEYMVFVRRDTTAKEVSVYASEAGGALSLLGTDTYSNNPDGGVVGDKGLSIMGKKYTTGDTLTIGSILGSVCHFNTVLSVAEMESLVDKATAAQTTYFDALLTADLEEDATKFTSTFSRASSQFTVVGGTLTEYATDVPAFGDTGLSAVDDSTNYCTYSDDLTNAAWTKTNLTAASGAPTTIVGRSTTKLTDSGGGGGYAEFSTDYGSTTAIRYFSVWLSCASGTVSVDLYAEDSSTTPKTASKTITVTTTPQRFWLQAGDFLWFNNPIKHRIIINDASGEVFATLAQTELYRLTDEMPTSGSTVTRAASNLAYGVSGLPVNNLSGSFTVNWNDADPLGRFVVAWVDSQNNAQVVLSKSGISFTKTIANVGYSTGVEAVSLTEGEEYEVTWGISSSSGISATINSVTATNANTTDFPSSPVEVRPVGTTSISQATGSLQVRNFKVTS